MHPARRAVLRGQRRSRDDWAAGACLMSFLDRFGQMALSLAVRIGARDRGTAGSVSACHHRRPRTARGGGARGSRAFRWLATGGLPPQRTATLTTRSSPGRTVPRPSVLLVVSHTLPSGVTSTV